MKILYCDCAYYDLVDSKKKKTLRSALKSSGMEVVAVDDLCRIAAKDSALLKKIAGDDGLAVAACFPRTVKALFDFAKTGNKVLDVLNIRTSSAKEIIAKLKSLGNKGRYEDLTARRKDGDGDWVPWFPVIEYGRCVNCKQCVSFCLFGVYELSKKGRAIVAKPENCKTNCPACAKVCPKSAIIFPKYSESPINGGELNGNPASARSLKIDYGKLLGGDAYAALRLRGRNATAELLKDYAPADAGKKKKPRLFKKSK